MPKFRQFNFFCALSLIQRFVLWGHVMQSSPVTIIFLSSVFLKCFLRITQDISNQKILNPNLYRNSTKSHLPELYISSWISLKHKAFFLVADVVFYVLGCAKSTTQVMAELKEQKTH